MNTDYVHVTEVSGDEVSQEQVHRMLTRYEFARRHCEGKDVFEVDYDNPKQSILSFAKKTKVQFDLMPRAGKNC